MWPKRKRYSEKEEQTRSLLIEKVRNSVKTHQGLDETVFDEVENDFLSDVKKKTKAAEEFTLDEAQDMFDLQHKDFDPEGFYRWNIADLPELKISECFRRASPRSSHI